MLIVLLVAAALACASVGGGLYEFAVVDPFWPKRPDLVQPARGGISRKRFWIAIHVAFEVVLIAAVVWSWSLPAVRVCLLGALASHAVMRLWSAFDFIPKALAFEKAEPSARRRRGPGRRAAAGACRSTSCASRCRSASTSS